MFTLLVNQALALLIASTLALPTPDSPPATTFTQSDLVSIAPKSSSCAGDSFTSECRTAAQAAGPIAASFATYNVTSPAEQAAIISTIAFESADFQYQTAPGHPGQGTRNMQSPKYNLMYAQSIPALGPYLKEIDVNDPTAVLKLLVTYINYDFGSGAWFLTSQCDSDVRSKLQSGSLDGFSAYVGCIGTAMSSERTEYYQRAATALGVKTSK